MTVRVEWLTVGGPEEAWQRLGLVVHDGMIPLFGTSIRIDRSAEAGIVGWALSGLAEPVETIDGLPTDVVDAATPIFAEPVETIDGLPTDVVDAATPIFAEHPSGAIGLDHVVITTDSLERTCGAIEAATGAPLRRVREAGAMRQGFHRMGGLIVEVVEREGLPVGPASFWGLVINVEDLDAAVGRLGPDLVGAARPAVQPGRSIATVLESAGLGVPVALMTPG